MWWHMVLFFALKQLQLAFGKRDLNPSKETFVLKILEHFIETAVQHKNSIKFFL